MLLLGTGELLALRGVRVVVELGRLDVLPSAPPAKNALARAAEVKANMSSEAA